MRSPAPAATSRYSPSVLLASYCPEVFLTISRSPLLSSVSRATCAFCHASFLMFLCAGHPVTSLNSTTSALSVKAVSGAVCRCPRDGRPLGTHRSCICLSSQVLALRSRRRGFVLPAPQHEAKVYHTLFSCQGPFQLFPWFVVPSHHPLRDLPWPLTGCLLPAPRHERGFYHLSPTCQGEF